VPETTVVYDLTGHPQLDDAVVQEGPEYLAWQTMLAEQVLEVGTVALDGDAGILARAALVTQINFQEASGVDARVLASSTRAGVTFRSDLPLADSLAVKLWERALTKAAEGSGGGTVVPVRRPGDGWNTVRGLR
jgi:hypothetical protein